VVDGENYQAYGGGALFLGFGGTLWGYRDWDTFETCNGSHPNRFRQVSSLGGVTLRTLPSVHGRPGEYRDDWMGGRRPVMASSGGPVWVVVGCVKAGIATTAAFEAIFGAGAWDKIVRVPQALLDSLPTGPNAVPTVWPSGTIIRSSSGEAVKWVTHEAGSLLVPSPEVLASQCRAFAEVVIVSPATFAAYAEKGVMQSGVGACGWQQPGSDGFDFPIGIVGAPDAAWLDDQWYNANPFMNLYYFSGAYRYHLGEDWNLKTGGNTDCGAPVYAASNGWIVFAGDGGGTWGKVVIVRHRLPDGSQGETLYGHLREMTRTQRHVRRGEQLGTVGDGNGSFYCHLHFEIRSPASSRWGVPGAGTSTSANPPGWLHPTNYINARRRI
jgi:murein DD-endopeptidase MepM/ murein hydrolase activator NlpD